MQSALGVCVFVPARTHIYLIPRVYEFKVIRIRLQNIHFSSCVNTNYLSFSMNMIKLPCVGTRGFMHFALLEGA